MLLHAFKRILRRKLRSVSPHRLSARSKVCGLTKDLRCLTRTTRTSHELSRGARGSSETAEASLGTVRLAPQCWQTQTFSLGVSCASVNEVEQTGQINVPSEGLWDIGSPMGSPNNEK